MNKILGEFSTYANGPTPSELEQAHSLHILNYLHFETNLLYPGMTHTLLQSVAGIIVIALVAISLGGKL